MSKPQAVSIVELGKKLLKAAREGDAVQVRELMSKGAPFTTDWVSAFGINRLIMTLHYFVYILAGNKSSTFRSVE